ncbi:hypothetical protein DZF91_15410 [Actinomadura logoneensis]|uniref:Uncharacterized protein n=1 Tax=Actinomadura logoneensis TaxID=2293572 RepID=A0A372JL57_9ACTN|nr:hypothetical protein [Actinomadura logoneensis]RFU40762.1 hypothetical protein DZF91_15410 [Actinomadura logoneensis]
MAKRTRLLALAGGLDDIGLRARLVENVLKPTVLRCWDPDTMGRTVSVTCERSSDGRWRFWLHPGPQPLDLPQPRGGVPALPGVQPFHVVLARSDPWAMGGGVLLGDAQDIREPDDALEAARAIAAELGRWG